jgi:NhaP-type Na+/H+ or K+/H+ antiporter
MDEKKGDFFSGPWAKPFKWFLILTFSGVGGLGTLSPLALFLIIKSHHPELVTDTTIWIWSFFVCVLTIVTAKVLAKLFTFFILRIIALIKTRDEK